MGNELNWKFIATVINKIIQSAMQSNKNDL